jgi:hypothetical protein
VRTYHICVDSMKYAPELKLPSGCGMTLGPVVGFEGCLQRGTVCIWETFDRTRVMLREVGPQVAEYPWKPIWRAVCRVLYFEQELKRL